MRLSELKTGQKAVIVKVLGHGGFRKRIIEMGFVRGQYVEALQNAPLQDPVKYKIMSYEVSLRKSEASNIEVVTSKEAIELNETDRFNGVIEEDELRRIALRKRKHINVALVGNPNCGKTSLFNYVSGEHDHVGNFSGVTVGASVGYFSLGDYSFKLVDLPGTYSLSAYSPEEVYVRKHLVEESPDVVINVVDGTNLERNLFLTSQLIDMNVRMIIAFNMFDEFTEHGDRLDYLQLGRLLGAPIIPVVGKTGWGLESLFHVAIKVYEGRDFFDSEGKLNKEFLDEMHSVYHRIKLPHDPIEEIEEDNSLDRNYKPLCDSCGGFSCSGCEFKRGRGRFGRGRRFGLDSGKARHGREYHKREKHEHLYRVGEMSRHIHINHGPVLEEGISAIRKVLDLNNDISGRFSTRFLAIKVLEGDKEILDEIKDIPQYEEILKVREKYDVKIRKFLKEDPESALTNAKYGFISGALAETYRKNEKKDNEKAWSWDKIVLNKYLGYPIFLLFMYIMFQATFVLGEYPMNWIQNGVNLLSEWLASAMPESVFRDFLVDGIIAGVGGVLVFLPNIVILYTFISFMEDSGYMSRATFIMDKLMHLIGLHGKSFIPLIMGFGCSVPAIMATRTIENRNSRMVTILVTPFMSCSARLPVYILIAGTFFGSHAGLAMFGMYLGGILVAVASALLFKKYLFKSESIPFVMEFSTYRWPTLKAVLSHVWERAAQYLKKMGTTILAASVLIWVLGYFPKAEKNGTEQINQVEQSYISKIGKAVTPALSPLGFNWRMSVATVTGVAAKEVVVSTLGVLYNQGKDGASLGERLKADKYSDGTPVFNVAVALSFMVFILLYFPCIATVAAIKTETGSWKWVAFEFFYTLAVAWVASFIVYHIALFFI